MRRSSIVLLFMVTAMGIYLVFSVDQQLRADEVVWLRETTDGMGTILHYL